MTDFDGPPLEERYTSDDDGSRRLDYDTLRHVANFINGILQGRQLGLIIELADPPALTTQEEIETEKEKMAMRAGELTLAQEIKSGIELLIQEAQLDQ